MSGATLKLIDYGSLSKVVLETRAVSHLTPNFMQPFHTDCESVDLWAAGIILLNMLVITGCGMVFQARSQYDKNTGVEALRDGTFWESLEDRLRAQDPTNCVLERGPGSAQDLLQQIFVTEPQNSLSIEDVAEHPWLQGPVPTDEEMQAELKRRYQGILSGAPRNTVFFDLGQCTAEEGRESMHEVPPRLARVGPWGRGRDGVLGGVLVASTWSGCSVRTRLWPRLPHGCHRPLSDGHCSATLQFISRASPTAFPAPPRPLGPMPLPPPLGPAAALAVARGGHWRVPHSHRLCRCGRVRQPEDGRVPLPPWQ